MRERVQLSSTPIIVNDDEFANGCQVGYLHFQTHFQKLQITDDLVYTLIIQNITNVR